MLVGAFGANGVGEAHTDLSDGGIPIDRLEKRSVTIHMISFSPANMMLRVTRPAVSLNVRLCHPLFLSHL